MRASEVLDHKQDLMVRMEDPLVPGTGITAGRTIRSHRRSHLTIGCAVAGSHRTSRALEDKPLIVSEKVYSLDR